MAGAQRGKFVIQPFKHNQQMDEEYANKSQDVADAEQRESKSFQGKGKGKGTAIHAHQ